MMELNEASARKNILAVENNAGNMKENIEKAHTVRDSGALTYMPLEEVRVG